VILVLLLAPAHADTTVVTVAIAKGCANYKWPARPGDTIAPAQAFREQAIKAQCANALFNSDIASADGTITVRVDGVIDKTSYANVNKNLPDRHVGHGDAGRRALPRLHVQGNLRVRRERQDHQMAGFHSRVVDGLTSIPG
jgi:hypothetical protein